MPWHLIVLALLTIAGGVIRFTRLDRPPLLIDECFTFWRVCGSYGQLVEVLRDDGFVPLHYTLLCWIGHGLPIWPGVPLIHGVYLTPFAMRVFPAISGTLMIPTMYFLARQLLPKNVSLLTAGLASCSAYLLFFSRDAKMYSPTWLFATLAMACLLWWLRTNTLTAWLCWVAAGAAAAGFHVLTLLLLAVVPFAVLSVRRFTLLKAGAAVLGVALICAGPAGYYLKFNQWTQKSGGLTPGVAGEANADANWSASGLGWIGDSDDTGPMIQSATTSYLSSFEWWTGDQLTHRDVVFAGVAAGSLGLLLVMLILGLLPWSAIVGTPPVVRTDEPDRPAWRWVLVTAAWILLPAYGFFYARSRDDAGTPIDWINFAGELIQPVWVVLLPAVIVLAPVLWRRLTWRTPLLLASPALLAYLDLRHGGLDVAVPGWLSLVAFAGPLLMLWAMLGNSPHARLGRLAACVGSLAVVFAACYGASATWQFLRDRARESNPGVVWHNVWHPRYVAIIWPAVAMLAAVLIMRLPGRALKAAAIVLFAGINLANWAGRVWVDVQSPFDRAFADIWLAKPDAPVRTYFDFNSVGGGAQGFPFSPYYRPMAAYYACVVSRMEVGPPDVRAGKTWPFEYGPFKDRFASIVAYRPNSTPVFVVADVKASPAVDRVIVWSMDARTDEYTPPDLISSRLGSQWRLVSNERLVDRWYWMWTDRNFYRRREWVRAR